MTSFEIMGYDQIEDINKIFIIMDENNFLVCSRITHSTPNIFKRELCSIHHAQDLFFCYESKATTDLLARASLSSRVVAALLPFDLVRTEPNW